MEFLIIILIFVVLILGKIFYAKTNKNKIIYGNGQSIGTKEYLSDYFAVTEYLNDVLVVLSTAISDRKSGKISSVIAVDILKTNFIKGVYKNNIKSYFTLCYKKINKSLKDNIIDNFFGVRLICIIITKNLVQWSSIGTCALIIYRNDELKFINKIDSSEVEFGSFELKKNDILLICSKGIYENLSELEIEKELLKKIHPQEKAAKILTKIRNKNLKYQDNGTIVIIENVYKTSF